ncbi:MAG: glycosyltransferase [Flavobacteriaceae bacterium]
MLVTTIFLSRTATQKTFEMTLEAIASLQKSISGENLEIILVESNPDYLTSGFEYPAQVKVFLPNEPFNFHRFLNIGIQQAQGDYLALCNNDVLFHPQWMNEILKVSQEHPEIVSFSPSGKWMEQPERDYQLGYKVMQQIKGWCLVVKKEVFKTIGLLDETFSFYYADNDYAMTLKYYNLKHALVYRSYVEHLEKPSTFNRTQNMNVRAAMQQKYSLPDYLAQEQYLYVFGSESNMNDFLKFHNKWGSPKVLYRKNRIADQLIKYKLGFLNRLFLKLKF